jgi:hypothetical protein
MVKKSISKDLHIVIKSISDLLVEDSDKDEDSSKGKRLYNKIYRSKGDSGTNSISASVSIVSVLSV